MATNNKNAVLIANYVLSKTGPIDAVKLQKTLYFIEAFHLARFDTSLINEDFEAWKNGPVLQSVYKAFKDQSTFYENITAAASGAEGCFDSDLKEEQLLLVDAIVADCATKHRGSLMLDSHDRVWDETRKGLSPNDNSNRKMDKRQIRALYREELAKSKTPALQKINENLRNSINNRIINRFDQTWVELAK